MKNVMFLLALLCGLVVQTAEAETAADKMRATLERNFQACNTESIGELMDTQARGLAKEELDKFRAAAVELFEDTDVYLRLEDFQLLQIKGQFAAARVVQVTLPADETVRNNPNACERFYRNHTMLLPEHERVSYVQTFKREGSTWRLWQIVTKPEPVGEGASREAPVVSDCRNGRCRTKSAPQSGGAINVFR